MVELEVWRGGGVVRVRRKCVCEKLLYKWESKKWQVGLSPKCVLQVGKGMWWQVGCGVGGSTGSWALGCWEGSAKATQGRHVMEGP